MKMLFFILARPFYLVMFLLMLWYLGFIGG